MYACEYNHVEIANMLICRGAEVTAQNFNCVNIAIKNGHTSMFLRLMRISDILFDESLPAWDFLVSSVENIRPVMVTELLKRSYWYSESEKRKGFCMAARTGSPDLVRPFIDHFQEMMYELSRFEHDCVKSYSAFKYCFRPAEIWSVLIFDFWRALAVNYSEMSKDDHGRK